MPDMDPITVAGSFATIVGLLSNFKSERTGGDLSEFISWLKQKQHDDVAAAIERNSALFAHLSVLLAANHDELLIKLEQLDVVISTIASRIDGFSGVAKAIHPESELSEQAICMLEQFVNSGAKRFIEMKTHGRECSIKYKLIDGAIGDLQYYEPRFVEDDLLKLVKIGVLHLEFGNNGSRIFWITREAVRFIDVTRKNR